MRYATARVSNSRLTRSGGACPSSFWADTHIALAGAGSQSLERFVGGDPKRRCFHPLSIASAAPDRANSRCLPVFRTKPWKTQRSHSLHAPPEQTSHRAPEVWRKMEHSKLANR